jgi:putative membrane protein
MLWMVFWNIIWLALFGLLIWAIVRLLVRPHRPTEQGPSAPEILRQRYARGNIDAATFEQMHQRLQASTQRENPSVLVKQEV